MPMPELPVFEGRTAWLEPMFAESLARVRAELATWPRPAPEVDPILVEYQRRAKMGLCDPVAPEESGARGVTL